MKYKYRLDKPMARFAIRLFSCLGPKRQPKQLEFAAANSIAVVYPHLIGDIVMLTPFLRMLRKTAPQAKITFVGANWAKQILSEQNLVDEFVCFKNPRSMLGGRAVIKNFTDILRVVKTLRKKQFDIVIEPFGNFTAALFMHFLRATHYVGVDFSNLHCLQTFTVPYHPNAHLIDGLMELFKCTGTALLPTDYYPKVVLSKQQKQTARQFIQENKLTNKIIIGIHPGASVKSRRWRGFAQLIDLLCQYYTDTVICLFCGPGDEAFVQDIISHVTEAFKERIVVVKRPLAEYLAILSVCSHVVCNDSSCGHISAALGVPVTVLFAQGDPRFIAPRGPNKVNIISRDFPCKPCLQNECPKKTNECFTWITPEIVFEAVKNTLNREP